MPTKSPNGYLFPLSRGGGVVGPIGVEGIDLLFVKYKQKGHTDVLQRQRNGKCIIQCHLTSLDST